MRFSERGFAPSLSFDDRRMMELFIELFIVLFSGVIGYRFCGHCIAVIRHGGPAGDGAESLQRPGHFIRHCLYVAWVRIVGVGLVSVAIAGCYVLWREIAGIRRASLSIQCRQAISGCKSFK